MAIYVSFAPIDIGQMNFFLPNQIFFVFLQPQLRIRQVATLSRNKLRNNRLSNGVMAALQILVLSVQVRVLVGQQKTPHGMPCGVFFSVALAVDAPSAQGGTDTVGSI